MRYDNCRIAGNRWQSLAELDMHVHMDNTHAETFFAGDGIDR